MKSYRRMQRIKLKSLTMQHFYVYILRCKDSSFYVGHTDNLEKRLEEAFMAERKIKGWTRKKKEALIASDWIKISKLAKKKFEK